MNSLVTLVEQAMQLDPFSRAVFAFHNRGRDRIKLLLYDHSGFWLMMKRLNRPDDINIVQGIDFNILQLDDVLGHADIDNRAQPMPAMNCRRVHLPWLAGRGPGACPDRGS